MNNVSFDDLLKSLSSLDKEFDSQGHWKEQKVDDVEDIIENTFSFDSPEKYAVLGIDVYRYSALNALQQMAVAFLLEYFYRETLKNCLKHETLIFNSTSIPTGSIDTGDGRYCLFPSPLQALYFAIYFESQLRAFNAGNLFPKLRKLVGEVTHRYCLTYGDVALFENKYYGPAIIVNARILSVDRLNRFIVDEHANDWFLRTLGGLETLTVLKQQHLAQALGQFQTNRTQGVLIKPTFNYFRTIIVQRLAPLEIKGKDFNAYNLFIQADLALGETETSSNARAFVISIGNLNTNALEPNIKA